MKPNSIELGFFCVSSTFQFIRKRVQAKRTSKRKITYEMFYFKFLLRRFDHYGRNVEIHG